METTLQQLQRQQKYQNALRFRQQNTSGRSVEPKIYGALSFPSSSTSSTPISKKKKKKKKTSFRQKSTIHSRHVEFEKWREHCCQTQVPSIFIRFLSDPAIMWKPSIATIAQLFFFFGDHSDRNNHSDRSDHMETSL